jgi:hypothetical protein
MDVELPDGTVIEGVPEGTTKSQLMAKLLASGYDVSKLMPAQPGVFGAVEEFFTKPVAPAPANVQEQGYDPLAAYAERVAGNLPQDVMNVAQGFTPESLGALGSALYNRPLETASNIGSAALQGAGRFLSSPLETFAEAPVSTALGLQAAGLAQGVGRAALAPGRAVAAQAYPIARRAFSPQNRMLADVFTPEAQAALQEATPGMTVPQALADVNAPRAQAVVRQAQALVPEETRAAQLAQEQSRMERLTRMAGTPQDLEQAIAQRGGAATTNYQTAFQSEPPPISPELLSRPSMQVAVKEATNIAAERGAAATPMEALHNVKLALDQIVSKPGDYGLGGAQKAAIQKTRQQFIDELSMNPDYARARAEFAAQSVPINQMQVAQELLKAAVEPVSEGATRAGVFARAVEEAPKTIKRATGEQYFKKLEDVLPADQVELVNEIRDEFRRTKLADEQARLGASAAPEVEELASSRISSAMNIPFLNRTWTIANTIIKRSLGKIDEKLATEIGMMMQDPAELNRAIAKARRYAKETERGVARIRAPAAPVSPATRARRLTGAVNVMSQTENQNAMARR